MIFLNCPRREFRVILHDFYSLQAVKFTSLLQLVNKLQQACQFHQVATSLLRSVLLQLVIRRLITTC